MKQPEVKPWKWWVTVKVSGLQQIALYLFDEELDYRNYVSENPTLRHGSLPKPLLPSDLKATPLHPTSKYGGYPMICYGSGDSREHGCGYIEDQVQCSSSHDIEATCPVCQGKMQIDWSDMNQFVAVKGIGRYSSGYGQKLKRSMIARGEELGRSQWDNVDPGNVLNPEKVKNYTPGGPFDPNGKFAKKKKRRG